MLVLTRNVVEAIKIGDDVDITALRVRSGQAHVGINAPHSVEVHRKEIYERIQHEKMASATPE